MTAAWIVYSVAVGALAAGIAGLLHALRRDSGNALRWIWAGALLVTLGLSASAPWRVDAPIVRFSLTNATERNSTPVAVLAPTVVERARRIVERVMSVTSIPLTRLMSTTTRLPARVQRMAFGACITLAVGALLWLVTMYLRTLALRRSWTRDAMLGVPVRVAPDAGPAVIGVAPPEIVVPRWLMDRAPHEQQLVLEHEQAHVRARDPLLLLAACVAVALMPWNPALWYMLSRLRLAVELDCDRRVLRAGAPTRSYAQLLIELSAHRSLLSPTVPSFSHSISHLERRLLAMTTRPNRASLSVRLGGALLTAVALLAACESKLPTSAEVQDMTAASATKRAAEVASMDTLQTVYVLDGKTVSKVEAEAIASSRIASIDVTKATAEKKSSIVRIRTVAAMDTAPVQVRLKLGTDGDSGSFVTFTAREKRTARSDSVVLTRLQIQGDSATRSGGAVFSSGNAPVASKTKFTGLLLVNNVPTPASELTSIAPDQIESVEIIKGPTAVKLFNNPLAANGIIKITTKKKS